MVIAEFFIPHGHCYLWKPELVRLHIVSDALTALAYYSDSTNACLFRCQEARCALQLDFPAVWCVHRFL